MDSVGPRESPDDREQVNMRLPVQLARGMKAMAGQMGEPLYRVYEWAIEAYLKKGDESP